MAFFLKMFFSGMVFSRGLVPMIQLALCFICHFKNYRNKSTGKCSLHSSCMIFIAIIFYVGSCFTQWSIGVHSIANYVQLPNLVG